jgi:hypothetical protein
LGSTRINPRRVKIHFSYTINEIKSTFGVHKNTVRAWLKRGLATIDASRPILVHGSHLRAFLEGRRKASKCACPPGTFYCLKCRAPKPPAIGMVDFIPFNGLSGNLRGLCATCGTLMHRRVRRERIAAVMPNLTVQIVHRDPHIRESAAPSLNCDSEVDSDSHDKAQRR